MNIFFMGCILHFIILSSLNKLGMKANIFAEVPAIAQPLYYRTALCTKKKEDQNILQIRKER